MHSSQLRRAGVALVTAGALGAVALGGSGAHAADYDIGTGPVTIKMENKGKNPFFKASSKTISRGAKLTIKNVSSVKKVGPHTFSLVKKSLVPTTKKGFKTCFKGGICLTIATAHKFDPKTNKIHKASIEVGKKGWDTSFGKTGDSWYTEKKGASQTRKVTAPVGTTLTYFCAVHPNMSGTLKVVK